VQSLAALVRAAGAADLADRLERARADDVKLRALTLDERALMLPSLENPPRDLAELRAVLMRLGSTRPERRADGEEAPVRAARSLPSAGPP
jgi:hypothetical protein